MTHSELTSEEYKKFCELIYRTAGIRISDNKRVMVSNRVRRRLRALGLEASRATFSFSHHPQAVLRCRSSWTRSPPTKRTFFATSSTSSGWAAAFFRSWPRKPLRRNDGRA